MIPRVTSQTQMRAAQANLQASAQRLAQLQEQSSSLKTISRASDDPARAANALAVRAEQRATAQYTRNADNGNGWLTALDTALGASTTILNRVRDLTVQGANAGTMSPAAREAIALQIDGLKQDLLSQANATHLGRTVFAGNSDTGVAFTDAGVHSGGSTPGVDRRVGADSTVRVDADGAAVFGSGPDSIFALLATVSDALRNSPATVSSHLGAIDTALNRVIAANSDVGARQTRIESATAALATQKGTLEAQRVQLEDADLATVILDLKLQEVAYQSALAVTARVIQPTLMDFLS
ncbi:flagellar hook-associated protein 3 [Cryobacterium sp. LW097]|nr:flagellar hook-associated protein 3 [Cryobacterium sp. LW097]TFC53508.1 flagellar hook-associated protein 3 [Cryobacterium sp. TMB3-1-2]TFC59207.1 flagellar hook-associated protein 3 [Cryobacterium sp. TMB1-7]TFC69174.1 flagellar hook-associated protein 3 [Cryobacterium sp. TMB3-15]TFC76028.1 flagellar hook-associated protein 3 [Cryobacterium sp. TMB3-10]TFC87047.1 flagellar hook-associated protein 3 [Cryobacterium sp. TMT4-31]TFD39901.1 flagellar hook-associated protein 3 [Cryobacterium s